MRRLARSWAGMVAAACVLIGAAVACAAAGRGTGLAAASATERGFNATVQALVEGEEQRIAAIYHLTPAADRTLAASTRVTAIAWIATTPTPVPTPMPTATPTPVPAALRACRADDLAVAVAGMNG